ncbi:MAG TPA: response regulator [Pyrinomonadaceae bacterium]|nr:response regulator [Pyrinomonadaceae bacterium]
MSKRKLLLADDSVTIQKVVNLTFADEGIEVISVGDGDTALEKFLEVSPDLVMADVNMPGLTGYQLCEKIRENGENSQTPVILLVGSFEPFDEEEAKRVGADDFLTKPFQSIRQLVNKVTVLLNSAEATVDLPQSDDVTVELPPINQAVNPYDDTLRMEKTEVESVTTVQYSDTGYDDEMIEANQPSSFAFDESQKFETKPAFEPVNDYSATQPLSSDDIKDFELINSVAPNADETVSDSIETVSEYPIETTETVAEEETIPEAVEAESTIDEPETESSDMEDTTPDEVPVAETDDEMPLPEVASVLQLDEANPLELPPIELDFDESEDELETEDSAEVTQLHSPTTTESVKSGELSPEMIELIVQQVVERLSDKAVTNIAWEVVPDITERIIKKMAEEKLNEK